MPTEEVTRERFIEVKREVLRATYRDDQETLLSDSAEDGLTPEQFLTKMTESLADLYLETCGGYFL